MDLVRTHVTVLPGDVLLEPSAGAGAFVSGLTTLAAERDARTRFVDVVPAHPDVHSLDFLQSTPETILGMESGGNVHAIGNPPFGRQSTLARAFVRKAGAFCSTIAFILPQSFKKASLQQSFASCFHLEVQMDLPPRSFVVEGAPHDVPCVFQIWRRRADAAPRALTPRLVPRDIGLEFVAKDADPAPDVAFRRVGARAGVVSISCVDKSAQTHYFLRFVNGATIETNVSRLRALVFDSNNTVGPRSISKQELLAAMARQI
jgi:hypothetical protein